MTRISRLPEIGERIVVEDSETHIHRPATVISMHECCRINPKLFGWEDLPNHESETYPPDESIRAFLFEDGTASFCIMRFPTVDRTVFIYNRHLHDPEVA